MSEVMKKRGRPKTLPEFCTVEGCERKANCKNFCKMHYTRVKRDGVPGGVPMIYRNLASLDRVIGKLRRFAHSPQVELAIKNLRDFIKQENGL